MMHGFYGPGANFFGQGGFWFMGIAGMIIHLLFWVAVIYLGFRLFKKYSPIAANSQVKEDSALAILRERYAKGEISAEEFKQRKADLE